MDIGNHHVTIEDPIQDTSLCTQRGERKLESFVSFSFNIQILMDPYEHLKLLI
jgi:hypothetical protein